MANSEELQIVIRAVDEASKVLKDVKKQLGGTSGEVQKYAKDTKAATAGSSELHKEWGKLFNASMYLEEGLQDLRRAVTGILWSNVALVIASVVTQLIAYVVQAGNGKTSSDDMARSVADQAREWGLLPDKIKNVSQATIDLYNAQLMVTQFDTRDKGKKIGKNILDLTEANEGLAKSLSTLNAQQLGKEVIDPYSQIRIDDLQGKILKNNLALKEAKKELEDWQNLQGMKPQTLASVASSINRDKDIENRQAILADREKYAHEEYNLQMSISENYYKHLDERHAKSQEWEDKQLAISQAGHDAEIAMQERKKQAVMGALNFITTSALAKHKEFFYIMKAANMAQAYMDTMVAATRALAEGGPFLGPILAAAIKVAGLANIAAIASARFSGGGSGGGNSSGGGTSSGTGTSSTSFGGQQPQPAPQDVQIIVNGNIVDHAAFVRELQPYFKEVKVDTL